MYFDVEEAHRCQRLFRVTTITSCLSQTPPLFPRPMPDTDSALYDKIAAPVLAAVLHSRPMLEADSALYNLISALFLAAELALHTRPMLDTDSALYDFIVAPDMVAVFAFPRTPFLVMPHA